MSGKVHTAIELSEVVTSIIEVKHGCPLSPLLGACFARVDIMIVLYADDIVLISNTQEVLQRLLNALKSFCKRKDLLVNLDQIIGIVLTPLKYRDSIRTKFLLARGKADIYMILHISESNVHRALVLPTEDCLCSN